MRTPKVITRLIEAEGFFESEQEVKRFVKNQRASFRMLERTATAFPGWLALKLSCTPKQAEQVIAWATPVRKKAPTSTRPRS